MRQTIAEDLGELWHIRPPVTTVSDLQPISNLIKRTSKQKIQRRLASMSVDYPEFRNIRGDGNCFYRSIAFLYLRKHTQLSDFSKVFEQLPKVDMGMCTNCPEEFYSIYDDHRLKDELARSWISLFQDRYFATQLDKENYLMDVLNRYWVLDFLVVLYFRSLNYKYINENAHSLKDYVDDQDTIAMTLANVLKYGEDSQGLELSTMTQCIGSDIKIMFVRQDASVPVTLKSNISGNDLKVLLLTPGHYDILYSVEDMRKLREQVSRRTYPEARRYERYDETPNLTSMSNKRVDSQQFSFNGLYNQTQQIQRNSVERATGSRFINENNGRHSRLPSERVRQSIFVRQQEPIANRWSDLITPNPVAIQPKPLNQSSFQNNGRQSSQNRSFPSIYKSNTGIVLENDLKQVQIKNQQQQQQSKIQQSLTFKVHQFLIYAFIILFGLWCISIFMRRNSPKSQ